MHRFKAPSSTNNSNENNDPELFSRFNSKNYDSLRISADSSRSYKAPMLLGKSSHFTTSAHSAALNNYSQHKHNIGGSQPNTAKHSHFNNASYSTQQLKDNRSSSRENSQRVQGNSEQNRGASLESSTNGFLYSKNLQEYRSEGTSSSRYEDKRSSNSQNPNQNSVRLSIETALDKVHGLYSQTHHLTSQSVTNSSKPTSIQSSFTTNGSSSNASSKTNNPPSLFTAVPQQKESHQREESPLINPKVYNNRHNPFLPEKHQSLGTNQSQKASTATSALSSSYNLKDTIQNQADTEELKQLSKSIQGFEITRAIQQRTAAYISQANQAGDLNDGEGNSTALSEKSFQYQPQGKKYMTLQQDKSSPVASVEKIKQGNQENPQEQTLIGKIEKLPNHEPTKCSSKRNGIVKAYAANTNQGLVRNYNEDRVSIILNIVKPASRQTENWPKCSFFGVYDGHGGVNCADFLRDNLHQYVIKESTFPWNPKEALRNGFAAAETAFLAQAQANPDQIDRSGSCAIAVLIIGDTCYVANVGDSRAVLSGDGGQKVYTLSRDHKPGDDLEQKRIIQGGGKIYQTHATQQVKPGNGDTKAQTQLIFGPLRVFPGRLSVSRTFGDIEAKLERLGGNPLVVVAEPEIKQFKLTDEHDFIVLASDGVFDKMTSKEVIQSVWSLPSLGEIKDGHANVHQQCSLAVENILRDSLNKRSMDNVTVVMIAFNHYNQQLLRNAAADQNSIQQENQPLHQLASAAAQSQTISHHPLMEIKNNSHFNQQQQPGHLSQGDLNRKFEYVGGSKTTTAAAAPSSLLLSSTNFPFGSNNSNYNHNTSNSSNNYGNDFRKSLQAFSSTASFAHPYAQSGSNYHRNSYNNNNNNHHHHQHNNYTNNEGEGQLRKKLKENQQVTNENNYVSENTSHSTTMHNQFNKLKLIDQRISDISGKAHYLDRKIHNR